MFMRTKTHDLFVAALTQAFNGFIRKQGDTIKQLRRDLAESQRRHAITEREACAAAEEIGRLREQLENAGPKRGYRGRFVARGKGALAKVEAQMAEQVQEQAA